MPNTIIYKICLIFLSVLASGFLHCQKEEKVPETFSNGWGNATYEFEGLEAPHGGFVFHTVKYQVEFVFDPLGSAQNMTVYFLNNKYKTRRLKKITANATLNYTNGKIVKMPLISYENWLYCQVEDVINPFNMVIDFKVRKKKYVAAWFYKGLVQQ